MKYLFTSYHGGDLFINQNKDDLSLIYPGKNCFFEVLEKERNGQKCEVFCLIGDGKDYLVDLRDGHFEVNEAPFYLHDPNLPYSDFRLIFYKRVSKYFEAGFAEVGEKIEYNIGWQVNFEGQNIKRILSFS